MYSSYKAPGLKTAQKKKSKSITSVSTDKVRVPKPKPEWNDAINSTENPYKLSASEIVQKKISLMSKHRLEAKEEWNERQEKLRRGVVDDETKRIYDTARQSKNLSTRDDDFQRKNLSQMLNFIPKPQVQSSKTVVQDVKANLQETRKFIEKVEQYANDDDPNRLLHIMNKMQNNKDRIGVAGAPTSATSMHTVTSTRQGGNMRSLATEEQQQYQSKQQQQQHQQQQPQQPEMNNYFTSLDKIEETIKFMEEKILCERKKPQANEAPNQIQGKQIERNSLFQQHMQSQLPAENRVAMKEQHQNTTAIDSLRNVHSLQQSQQQRTRLADSDAAVSFNLTEGDDDYFTATRSKSASGAGNGNNVLLEDDSNDVKVNDFDIQPIDPNMFFMDDDFDDDNNHHHAFNNGGSAPKTRDGQIQFENAVLSSVNHEYRQQNNNNNSNSKYDNFSDEKSLDYLYGKQQPQQKQNQEDIRRNNCIDSGSSLNKKQYQTGGDKYVSHLSRKPLQQQCEDELEDDDFAADFRAMTINRAIQQNNNAGRTGVIQTSERQQQQQPQQKYQSYNNRNDEEDEGQGDNDGPITMNIDSIKEMLEATKRDLARLDEKPESSLPNRFNDSQHTQQQQGKRMQETVKVVSTVGLGTRSPVVAQSIIDNNNNTYKNNNYSSSMNTFKSDEISRVNNRENNASYGNTNNYMYEKDNNIDDDMKKGTKKNAIGSTMQSTSNAIERNTYKSLDQSPQLFFQDDQPMFMASNPFSTRTNDNPFTSNLFMSTPTTAAAAFAQKPVATTYEIPGQHQQHSLETFKKTLKTYSNNADSLHIGHHLQQ